jgi:beta-glucosidase
MKTMTSVTLFLVTLFRVYASVYGQNASADARIEALLSRMTLEEKIGQMNQRSGFSEDETEAIMQGQIGSLQNVAGAEQTNRIQRIAVEESRLGIPILFGIDVIHGFRTIFPIPLAQACAWDPDLVKQIEVIAAKEARAAGIHWTFSPMVDIARDARWGRIAEGAGEDPYLGSVLAAARVQGFQGTDVSSPQSIMACVKHYVAYGQADAGRDYNRVDVSKKTLYEIYLPPFKAGVEAGVMSVMSAFNTISGIPATANLFTLRDILRGQWGFGGFVVSDWGSIQELVVHGFAANNADAAKKALQAGVDMDMMGHIYGSYLLELVRTGDVPSSLVDDAVRRILMAKDALGLFNMPYNDVEKENNILLHEDHLAYARHAAGRSMVLLKNENHLLPLNKNIKSIAVIGPLADSRDDYLGTWACMGRSEDVVTVLEGLRNNVASGTTIQYAKGCDVLDEDNTGFAEAVTIAEQSDVVIAVVGESRDMSGEAASRTSLDVPGRQQDLLEVLHETGVPIVVVLMNGRPLSIPWMAEHIPAILEAWHPGVQGGNAVADVLLGDTNPSGKLTVSFPWTVGQCPIYYNHENTGRPAGEDKYTSKYLDCPETPLFPFGYGLSYTTFEYSNLRLSQDAIEPGGTLTVRADITNTGAVEGEEIVQLYIRDIVASWVRPVKELKGFQKIHLRPGEKKTVEFSIGPKETGFYDPEGRFIVQPGDFKIWIAWNSADGLEGQFRVQ